MATKKKQNLFDENPFIDGFLDWMDSPYGQQSIETMDVVLAILDEVDLNAKGRKLIWPCGAELSIDESVKRIHKVHSELSTDLIEEQLISWIEGGYAPQNYSEKQFEELDRLTERWIEAHEQARQRR